jgi:diguanylate cyclase (GGDEF)-like protein/PAS domain S-box-containing protein
VTAILEGWHVDAALEQGRGRAAKQLGYWLADRGGLLALAGLAFALGSALWMQFRHAGGSMASEALLLPAVLAGAYVAWRASWSFDLPRERRLAWRCLALGIGVVGVATLLSLTLRYGGLGKAAFHAGALRLAFYPLAAVAGFWLIRSTRESTPKARFWLDALAVAVSFGVLLWLLALKPTLTALILGAPPESHSVLYPLLDAALFLLAAVVLLGGTGRLRSPAMAWLAVAMAMLLVGDLAQAGLPLAAMPAESLPALLLHSAAYALLGIAAHTDHVAASTLDEDLDGRQEPATETGLLPFTGLFLAMGSLVYQQIGAWSEPAAVLALAVCATGVIVLLRQRLATREVAGREALQARRAAEARFTSLVRNSSDVIAISGEDHRLFYVTPSAERVFGLRAEDLVGQRLADLVAVEDRGRVQEFLVTSLAHQGATETIELRVPRGRDRFRVVEIVGTNLTGEPTVAGWVLNIRDITDRKGLEDQLKRLAFHDPLTLLANRALFRDRAEHALAGARRRSNQVAAIFVDLDNFKKINDSLGHGEGDRVLRATAQRLSKCTRTGDTVARLGGDEFAVLIEDAAQEQDAIDTASRIVEALKEPFSFSGSSLRVAASVGVAFAGQGEGVEELLRNADVAMYHAKSHGKGRYSVFQPRMQEAVHDRLKIEADLARAIGRNELRLLFQPIVDLESGYLLGVEALVRWQHPERGLIPPSEFIGVAEETGQVVGLGRWVLYEACSQVREWQQRMPMGELLRVAVNVSSQQLQGADLVAEVTGALEHSRLDPGCLVIEMTESVVMQDTEATFAKLKNLKRLGIRIAIDDFGTGYSSLSYLHRFPIDILKIDRSFVQRLGEEKDGTELARAIITLGETLGLEVVAEGIEYEHQLRQLIELGCVAGQGFYYSKPALLKEIEYSHHARLRQTVARDLPPETLVSATGRFKRPDFKDFPLELEATGSLGR